MGNKICGLQNPHLMAISCRLERDSMLRVFGYLVIEVDDALEMAEQTET